jgi:hypothetical protein
MVVCPIHSQLVSSTPHANRLLLQRVGSAGSVTALPCTSKRVCADTGSVTSYHMLMHCVLQEMLDEWLTCQGT